MRRLMTIAGIAISATMMSPGSLAVAEMGSHGHKHADNHGWYQTLKRPGTDYSCCSNVDCGATKARYFNGGWEALFEGRWMSVPRDKVLDAHSPDGAAHICAAKNANQPYCFIPPDPES